MFCPGTGIIYHGMLSTLLLHNCVDRPIETGTALKKSSKRYPYLLIVEARLDSSRFDALLIFCC